MRGKYKGAQNKHAPKHHGNIFLKKHIATISLCFCHKTFKTFRCRKGVRAAISRLKNNQWGENRKWVQEVAFMLFLFCVR